MVCFLIWHCSKKSVWKIGKRFLKYMIINKLYIGIISTFVTIIIIAGALFTVDQRETAVVFQFGEAVRVVDTPGLKIKIPFIQDVQFLDKRVLNVSAEGTHSFR
jgi:regulator of protease activity HflC (stomatin/prohibitin superfamily)